MHRLEFLRLNKNVWIVVFVGFTDAEIQTVCSSLDVDFSDIDYSKKTKMVASSYQAPGYTIVQLDRPHRILPPEVKEIMRTAANDFLQNQSGIPNPHPGGTGESGGTPEGGGTEGGGTEGGGTEGGGTEGGEGGTT